MRRHSPRVASRLLTAALCTGLVVVPLAAQVSVRSVKVLGSKDTVEIEVEASNRIVPETQVLSDPDRLVVDFPNAVPGNQLRSQSVDRGEVKDVRVGLFQSKPPVTRVVVDLKTARSYQVFPNGRTVMIKVTGGAVNATAGAQDDAPPPHAGLVAASYVSSSEPVTVATPPRLPLDVSYRDGLLGIRADKATLAEVLYAIQQRTGADISIAAGAEQERVVAEIEPAPAPEVLARLLNGSHFNFLILNSPDDPRKLGRVILSPRTDGFLAPLPPPVQAQNVVQADDETAVIPNQPSAIPPPVQAPPSQDPEARAAATSDNPPEQ
jgi:AMIN domain-containing protein